MRAPLLRAALCVLAAACHNAAVGAAPAGPAPATPELWAALEALAGPTEPAAIDQTVWAARAAARPLAAGLLALEAGGGGLGLALAGLLPARPAPGLAPGPWGDAQAAPVPGGLTLRPVGEDAPAEGARGLRVERGRGNMSRGRRARAGAGQGKVDHRGRHR